MLSNILLSRLTPYLDEIIEVHQYKCMQKQGNLYLPLASTSYCRAGQIFFGSRSQANKKIKPENIVGTI
jgi:hypothetical protein